MNDSQAAELYLKYWQLTQGSSEDDATTDATIGEIDEGLRTAGYNPASWVIFDRDGTPNEGTVKWQNSDFDWEEWHERGRLETPDLFETSGD